MMSMNGPYPCIPDISEMVNSYKEDYDKISARIKEAETALKKLKEERKSFQQDFHKTTEEVMRLYGVRKFEGDRYVTELVTEHKPEICTESFNMEFIEIVEWLRDQLPEYVDVSLKPKLAVLKTLDRKELPGWCEMKSSTRISIRKVNSTRNCRRIEGINNNARIMISDSPCTISELASRINESGMLRGFADAVSINRWLLHEGLIENDPVMGRHCKIPTALGASFGIMVREGTRNDGKP